MAMEPNATGAVFANTQMPAAWKGEKPRPLKIAAATATGVPKPAAPSRNAPKAKAIKRACKFLSEVSWPMEVLMISNLPVSTVIRYKTMAQKMTQKIGNAPKAAPYKAALRAWFMGIPKGRIATSNATAKPSTEDFQALVRLMPIA